MHAKTKTQASRPSSGMCSRQFSVRTTTQRSREHEEASIAMSAADYVLSSTPPATGGMGAGGDKKLGGRPDSAVRGGTMEANARSTDMRRRMQWSFEVRATAQRSASASLARRGSCKCQPDRWRIPSGILV